MINQDRTNWTFLPMIYMLPLIFGLNLPCASPGLEVVAERILVDSGTRGGLIVHLGCGEGKLASQLRAGPSFLVHGLDTDAARISAARRRIQSLGAYGPVSVETFDGKHLPYADNLVNLIVISHGFDVNRAEILRVLAPHGVCVRLDGEFSILDSFRKPWPREMDAWPHFLHGPDGNAVSRDRQVGVPNSLRWLAGPKHSRHHDEVLGTSAMVTGGGRLFSIVDEAPRSTFHPAIGGKFFLIARDAFNGLVLWKKRIDDWGWQAWGSRQNVRFGQPIQLPKRMVVDGDRLYVTLGWNSPVSVLNARTGAVVDVLSATDYADELLLADGKLIVSAYRDSVRPIQLAGGDRGRTRGNLPDVRKRILAIDLATARKLWQSEPLNGLNGRFDAVSPQTHLELTVRNGRVFAVTKDALLCFSLHDGKRLWSVPRPEHPVHHMLLGVNMGDNVTVVADDDRLYVAQPVGHMKNTFHTIPCDLYAYDAESGERLWKQERKIGSFAWGIHADLFLIDGRLWSHEHIASKMQGADPVRQESIPYALLGIDAKTGEIQRRIDTRAIFNVTHHHRCYRNAATERFVLCGRRGTELIDLESGDLSINHWVRGECRLGLIPGNGLLYAPPDPCSCHARIKVNGLLALASAEAYKPETRPRLFRGPAYGDVRQADLELGDWPTHRGDAQRRGVTAARVEHLSPAWEIDLSDDITQAVCVGSRAFVSCRNSHRIRALSLEDGALQWEFTASGRIDSPPTFSDGQLLFGCSRGYAYCVRADDGQLAWKFRAAPADRLIVAQGQLESAWPVHGSLLAQDGTAFVVAGRTSYLDGGIDAFALDIVTGRIQDHRQLSSKHSGDRLAFSEQAFDADGALNRILVSDGKTAYLQSKPLFVSPKAEAPAKPFLMATCGLLDGSMFNRFGWILVGAGGITGNQIVHDDHQAFVARATATFNRSATYRVGSGFEVLAFDLPTSAESFAQFEKNAFSSLGYRATPTKPVWRGRVPIRVQAMLLTPDKLLVAGPPDTVSHDDPYAAFEGRLGGTLLVVDRKTGATLQETTLDSPPVWDGISCAAGKLLVAKQNGRLTCYDVQ